MTDREAIEVLFNEWKCIDRNDGIHCDRKCESCDLVMDVQTIREAFNMAISALQAQESPKPTAESVQNVPKEDVISRKEAIEAMSESLKRVFPEHRQIAEKCLNVLPPAQPEHTCVGCKHYVMWENEVEYGYNSPCTNCRRRTNDNYEQ